MKANPTRNWTITLLGGTTARRHVHVGFITGTIEDALAEADVLECDVRWQVLEVRVAAQAGPETENK